MKMKGFKKGMALILALAFALSFGLTFKPMEVNAAEITSVDLEITSPVPGSNPTAVTTTSTQANVDSYEWKDGANTVQSTDVFGYNKIYTLTIVLKPNDAADTFSSSLTINAAGLTATSTDTSVSGQVTVTYNLSTPKASVDAEATANFAAVYNISQIMTKTFPNGTDQTAIESALNAPSKISLTMEDGTNNVVFDITWQTESAYDASNTSEQTLIYYPQTTDAGNYDLDAVNDWMKNKGYVAITVEAEQINPPIAPVSLKTKNKDTFTLGGNEDLVITFDPSTLVIEDAMIGLTILPNAVDLPWTQDELNALNTLGLTPETLQENIDKLLSGQITQDQLENDPSLANVRNALATLYQGKLMEEQAAGRLISEFLTLSDGIRVDGPNVIVPASILNKFGTGTVMGQIMIEGSNGEFAQGFVQFTIVGAGSSQGGGASPTTGPSDSPKTGDGNAIGLFLALAILSIGGVVVTAKSKKVAE
ncbi:MAG: LPXTG cell wall anchor domain-containing protein [Clostridia bacterium]|nr:LPXTG cell wall anchor domain-containing protein [Clostridia bacterium]